jgi:tetratricopeptide (TPR) repeat protein
VPVNEQSALSRLDSAFELLARGEVDEALSCAEVALAASDPELRLVAHLCCALAWRQLGRHDAVIQHLQICDSHPAAPVECKRWMGDAYLACGAYMKAITYYDELLIRYPRRFDVHRRKLRALWGHICSFFRGTS